MMVPLLSFVFHEGVRSAAAECLPCLMSCAKGYGMENVKQMWQIILVAYKFYPGIGFKVAYYGFRTAIDKETDLEVLCEQLNGISNCIEEFGETLITNQDLEFIFSIIHEQLMKFENRRMEKDRVNLYLNIFY